jgi:hypothetical protein
MRKLLIGVSVPLIAAAGLWLGAASGTAAAATTTPASGPTMAKPDANGNIWIGTERGAARYDGRHFQHYTAADGSEPPEAAVVGAAALAAALGTVGAPPFEHAPKAMAASNASAPIRRDVALVTRCSLLMTASGACGRYVGRRNPSLDEMTIEPRCERPFRGPLPLC